MNNSTFLGLCFFSFDLFKCIQEIKIFGMYPYSGTFEVFPALFWLSIVLQSNRQRQAAILSILCSH